MQNRNLRLPLAFCLGLLVLAATSLTLSAAEPPAADAAYLEQVSAELARTRAEPASAGSRTRPAVRGRYLRRRLSVQQHRPHGVHDSHRSAPTTASPEDEQSLGLDRSPDRARVVLLGLDNGTAFIDITDPEKPVYAGKLPSHNGIARSGATFACTRTTPTS